ncbi:MAG: 16S rRNA (adenine(1518)-N(6)/adenine(1519)-N(6))-dimethyltransferase [Endomicrobia bacterium]|nr:16S rRNA (adenine(1518)-N(6)/adenine(1519)-N(6))-dimethyltransferase [Endomicrobiia bacterium]
MIYMRQKHGQNFLTDLNIANNIIKAAHLSPQDEVLEIGPGKGVLTKLIQPQVKRLTAVEIDPILAQQLKHYFSFHNINNVEIVNADFLKRQSEEWGVKSEDKDNGLPRQDSVLPRNDSQETSLRGNGVPEAIQDSCRISTPHSPLFTLPLKIISNLPYNVGTAIIQKILPIPNWTTAVFMLQKEVAHRLAAKCGSPDYGYISIFTQYYADCEVLFDVSPRCFTPQPKVVSTVIKLTNRHSPEPELAFFELVKHSFSMRRKTILNCLSTFKNLDKSQANKILTTCNLDPILRPGVLSISDFLHLTNEIKKYIIFQS